MNTTTFYTKQAERWARDNRPELAAISRARLAQWLATDSGDFSAKWENAVIDAKRNALQNGAQLHEI